MKRKFALILSAVMAASSLPLTAYAANFKDINNVPWAGAETVINSVADKGLLSGYEDGTFRAKGNADGLQCAGENRGCKIHGCGGGVCLHGYAGYISGAEVGADGSCLWAEERHHRHAAGGNKICRRQHSGNERGCCAAVRQCAWDVLRQGKGCGRGKEVCGLLEHFRRETGDNYNNFNPKKNINRAEMAVMLNKTNSILTEGVEESGTITKINVNEGKYYYIQVSLDKGGTEGIQATLGEFPVYVGNTTETISLSKLSEGDKVSMVLSGGKITALRQTKGTTNQEKYDLTGYVTAYKDEKISFERVC